MAGYFKLILVLFHVSVTLACLSGGRTSMRGRPGRFSNREPLLYGQYVPNRSELSVSASGPTEGRISRGSDKFSELVKNNNLDVVFKDEEETGADRYMSKRCKDKLDTLAIMVMNQWVGVQLRVTEGWDEDGEHASDSLHYEGRAVDISTSDRDRNKLPLLGRLAYEAGFDYVSYESRHHIHASVKSDAAESMMTSGCFAADSLVTLQDGSQKSIRNVQVGDEVQSADLNTGEIIYDTVIMLLDKSKDQSTQFIQIIHDYGEITLTKHHLIYISKTHGCESRRTILAKDVAVGHSIFLSSGNGTLQSHKVHMVKKIIKKGYYAPLTYSGNIIVNKVVSSCYASISSHWLAHLAMFPVRMFHSANNVLVGGATQAMITSVQETGVHWYAQLLINLFPFLLST